MGKTVMIFGLGDLGGWALEFLARCEGVGTIIASDLREELGVMKTHTAAVGAAQLGYYKTIKFQKCDVRDIDGTAELLKTINPDLIYSTVTLAAWSQMAFFPHEIEKKAEKASLVRLPLQILLVSKLMQAVKKSGITAPVLNHSLPDIVNPVLWRNGLGPLCGIGNLDIVVSEIYRKVSLAENVPIREITICMVAAHSVGVMGTRTGVPFFFKILVRDKDITSKVDIDSLISDRLMGGPAPDRVFRNWYKYPIVASCAVKNIMAILNDTNLYTHAPGPIGLPGGYPVRLSAKGVEVVLPEEITLEEAIKINLDALKCEGIEEIKDDGTLVSTEEGYEINKEILGVDLREVKFADTEDVSKEVISALRKAAEKYGASLPVY
ncbi:hypothetical protein ES703_57997 [subsurface metagenome]